MFPCRADCGILYFIEICLLNDFDERKGLVMANRVTIQIAGQRYTMLADESEEYMHEVAELAQQTIAECGGSPAFASTRALALACVKLTDEYLKANKAAQDAAAKCRALEAENEALRSQAQRGAQTAGQKRR